MIQSPVDGQNYNRYAYVFNNPLIHTDPTGLSSWTKVRGPVWAIVIAVATEGMGSAYADAVVGVEEFNAGVCLASSAQTYSNITLAFSTAGGFAAGGVAGGNIESAISGAVFAGLNYGVGEVTGSISGAGGHAIGNSMAAYVFNVVAHAGLGCAQSTSAGGSCKSGALAGGFSAAAGPLISFDASTAGGLIGGTIAHSIVGCIGGRLGGGDCGQGALVGAFEYLFNQVVSSDIRSFTDVDTLGNPMGTNPLACEAFKMVGGAAVVGIAAAGGSVAASSYYFGAAMTAQLSVEAAAGSGVTVLGRYPQYLEAAQKIGANALNVPLNLWNRLGTQMWEFNKLFLDRVIARGDIIRFTSDPRLAPPASITFRELQYLTSQGYMLSSNARTMMPPSR